MFSADNTSLHVEIDSPCPADLPHLTAEERIRFCTMCDKDVHNLSAMTKEAASELLDSNDDLCVSYEPDEAGAVSFGSRRKHPVGRWVSLAASVVFTLASQTGCGDAPQTPNEIDGKNILEKISKQASGLFRQKGTFINPPVMGGISRQIKQDKASTALKNTSTAAAEVPQSATTGTTEKPVHLAVRGRRVPKRPQ